MPKLSLGYAFVKVTDVAPRAQVDAVLRAMYNLVKTTTDGGK